jgi:N-methylhydantoinase A/oxoprolinase/acetone carboxylase beta subunit
VTTALEGRYQGQSHEIRVPSVEDFAAAHERRNGYARPGTPVEVVAIRATARRASPVALGGLPAPARTGAIGPAVVAEPDCTIWVAPGWRADPDPTGALILTRTRPGATGPGVTVAERSP